MSSSANFEGIAIGPKLADGSNSIVLVADNGGSTMHHFMPLRIRTEAPKAEEPAAKPEPKPKAKRK